MAKKTRIAVQFEDDPNRSIPLNFDLSCPPALSALCHWCTGEVLKFRGKTVQECGRATLNKIENAVDLVLANLINARKTSSRCFVGISNNSNSYTANRYRQRQISYTHLRHVLRWLVLSDPPYSSFVPGFIDRRSSVGRLSRYKATDRFLLTWNKYKSLPRTSAYVDVSSLNDIRSDSDQTSTPAFSVPSEWTPRFTPTKDCIQRKNAAGDLEEYVDDDNTRSMRQRLTEWNDFAALHHIDILLKDDKFESLFDRREADEEEEENAFYSDEKDRPQFIQLERFRLYRVFNNGSFDLGGRFYGGWWQRIPRDDRPYITINGQPPRKSITQICIRQCSMPEKENNSRRMPTLSLGSRIIESWSRRHCSSLLMRQRKNVSTPQK